MIETDNQSVRNVELEIVWNCVAVVVAQLVERLLSWFLYNHWQFLYTHGIEKDEKVVAQFFRV